MLPILVLIFQCFYSRGKLGIWVRFLLPLSVTSAKLTLPGDDGHSRELVHAILSWLRYHECSSSLCSEGGVILSCEETCCQPEAHRMCLGLFGVMNRQVEVWCIPLISSHSHSYWTGITSLWDFLPFEQITGGPSLALRRVRFWWGSITLSKPAQNQATSGSVYTWAWQWGGGRQMPMKMKCLLIPPVSPSVSWDLT